MGNVDFDLIFGTSAYDSKKTPVRAKKQGKQVEVLKTAEKPPKTATEPYTRLQREADKRKQERERFLEGIAEYQDNIRKAGTLRADILKGLQSGEDLAKIVLQACKVISLQTGDKTFYEQAEAEVTAIYGYGLKEVYPLHRELQKAQERLTKLEAAEKVEQDTAQKRRLQEAIRRHREKINYINESLQ